MYELFEKLCKENGVTPYRVSKATGISTATLSDWKTGKSHPKADKIKLISDYFNVDPSYFQTGKKGKVVINLNAKDLRDAITEAVSENKGEQYTIDGLQKQLEKMIDDEFPEQDIYYTDPETARRAEEMATNPELRALFDVQRNMDPEDLKALYGMALALKRKAERMDSDDPA
jgi:transcriptional regulator with XRE-family HTH domain